MWQLIAAPILGIIGGAIEKYHEYKQEQLKAKERALDRQHELAVMDKEATLALKKLTVEGEIKQQAAEQQVFADSYKFNNDKLIPADAKLSKTQLNWVVAVEVISKAVRPLSTIWYQVLIAVIFGWSAWKLVDASTTVFSMKEIAEIYRQIVFSILGMGETTLLWWYGIRRMSKKKPA